MSDLTYFTLQDAIPQIDAILSAAIYDHRRGWSDVAVYAMCVDAVAASNACPYRLQRIALAMLRNELNIPDSIERRMA